MARDTPVQPERAAKIGAALVDASLVDPAVLGRSLTVIARQLSMGDATLATDPARVAAVQEAVAAGYVRALRDRTRADTQRSADEVRRGADARFQAELRHQAQHDPLTGVANRALFLDQLAAVVAPATPAAPTPSKAPKTTKSPPARPPAASASATWTWTASPRSTTPSAMMWGMSCWSRWRGGCRAGSGRAAAWSPGSAATSSSC